MFGKKVDTYTFHSISNIVNYIMSLQANGVTKKNLSS